MGFIIFSRHIDGHIPFLSICENIYPYALAKTGTYYCSISLDIPSVPQFDVQRMKYVQYILEIITGYPQIYIMYYSRFTVLNFIIYKGMY